MLLSYYVAAALLVHRGCGDTLDFCDDAFGVGASIRSLPV